MTAVKSVPTSLGEFNTSEINHESVTVHVNGYADAVVGEFREALGTICAERSGAPVGIDHDTAPRAP